MSINPHPNHMPVFHHIAKNAGTYTLSWMMMLCRKYNLIIGKNEIPGWTSKRIRRSIVLLEDDRQLTCCIHTPTDVANINNAFERRPGSDEVTDYVELEPFIASIVSGDVEPFSISIDPMQPGLVIPRLAINEIMVASKRDHQLNFTVLRDPYERCQSLYNYLKSNKSKHESTHNSIVSENFLDFLVSEEVEDSWFIRNILDMPEGQIIEPYHLTLAHEWLQYFRMSDISGVDTLIDSVFHGCYGIMQSDIEPNVAATHINKNKSRKKVKYEFSDLPVKTQQTFLDRTYWDRKLWERYCKNVDIS